MSYQYGGQCGSCKEYSFEGDNKKGYCSYYRSYFYPDDRCDHYDESTGRTGCWLTSACCKAKGLSDDCNELQALRSFRDSILKEMPCGQEMIAFYYAQAPRIVKQIDQSENQMNLYEEIYQNIQKILVELQEKDYKQVVIDYLYMMYTIDLKSRGEHK